MQKNRNRKQSEMFTAFLSAMAKDAKMSEDDFLSLCVILAFGCKKLGYGCEPRIVR